MFTGGTIWILTHGHICPTSPDVDTWLLFVEDRCEEDALQLLRQLFENELRLHPPTKPGARSPEAKPVRK